MNPLAYYEVVRELNNDKLRTAEKRRLASNAARMPKTDRRPRLSWLSRRSERPAVAQ
jgi:hypothetical protein